MYSTGNQTRDQMIVNVAARLSHHEQPMELAAAQKLLPAGFDLDDNEWSGILSNYSTPPAAHMAGEPPATYRPLPEPLENSEVPCRAEPEKSGDDSTRSAPRLDFDTANVRLRALQDQLAEHRRQVRELATKANTARGKLNEAITNYQVGGQQGTAEERRMANIRAAQATSQANRAARMESIPAELRGRYGSAAAFVRKQRQVPSTYTKGRAIPGDPSILKKGESRGAFPAQMRVLPGVKPSA